MSGISDDRWTCPHPGCSQSYMFSGTDEECHNEIVAKQRQHGNMHAEEAASRSNVTELARRRKKKLRLAAS